MQTANGNRLNPIHDSSTVLLVEDDTHFAHWAQAELRVHCPDLVPVLARDLAEARAWLASPGSTALRLAVVDLHLGTDNGIDLIAELSESRQGVPILVVTSVDTPEEALRAIRAGAQGYLLKLTVEGELGRAVTQIREGGSPINPGIAHLLLREFRGGGPVAAPAPSGSPSAPPELLSSLSARETEVLNLIARGFSDKEVAARLKIAPSTVDTHVRSIYRKFSVHSRAQLRGLINA